MHVMSVSENVAKLVLMHGMSVSENVAKSVLMHGMSVSEIVAKQVGGTDHLTCKYSFLLIN